MYRPFIRQPADADCTRLHATVGNSTRIDRFLGEYKSDSISRARVPFVVTASPGYAKRATGTEAVLDPLTSARRTCVGQRAPAYAVRVRLEIGSYDARPEDMSALAAPV